MPCVVRFVRVRRHYDQKLYDVIFCIIKLSNVEHHAHDLARNKTNVLSDVSACVCVFFLFRRCGCRRCRRWRLFLSLPLPGHDFRDTKLMLYDDLNAFIRVERSNIFINSKCSRESKPFHKDYFVCWINTYSWEHMTTASSTIIERWLKLPGACGERQHISHTGAIPSSSLQFLMKACAHFIQ